MIWNPQSAGDTSWAGNVPGGQKHPVIKKVAISGSGRNLKFTITGSGFGSAPRHLPFTGDLSFLRFYDWGQVACENNLGLFEAGFSAWGQYAADPATLRYTSWTSTKIVVSGFAGAYNSGCNRALPGDPITIGIWASGDSADTGPQTAWAGRIE